METEATPIEIRVRLYDGRLIRLIEICRPHEAARQVARYRRHHSVATAWIVLPSTRRPARQAHVPYHPTLELEVIR